MQKSGAVARFTKILDWGVILPPNPLTSMEKPNYNRVKISQFGKYMHDIVGFIPLLLLPWVLLLMDEEDLMDDGQRGECSVVQLVHNLSFTEVGSSFMEIETQTFYVVLKELPWCINQFLKAGF